jgi:hypothetical protein
MRGEQWVESMERDLRAQIALLLAALEEQRENNGRAGESIEMPSEMWRAFNLSNVACGRLERAMKRRRGPRKPAAQG